MIEIKYTDEYKLNIELRKIKKWFEENDWIPNKIITKEWNESDIRWQKYLNERNIKRQRQDEINLLLNKN